ncbi:MAG: hypothetical protein JXA28_14060 [Bacteroidetes bacterium]|nr:hypothetical protein [Bacteroidota bacterium]
MHSAYHLRGQDGGVSPGIYLVSTASGGGGHFVLYGISDDFDESLHMKSEAVSVAEYSIPLDGYQKGSEVEVQTNDCRALSGFYLDGIIHFVHHDRSDTGYTEIRYVRYPNDANMTSKIPHGSMGKIKNYSIEPVCQILFS